MSGTFLADAIITGIAAWLFVCASGHGSNGWLEAALAWLWSCVALIAGVGAVLGITGGFAPSGFLAGHALVLAVVVITRRRMLAADWLALRATGKRGGQFLRTPGGERWISLGLVVVLSVLTLISAFAEPGVMDALTYHLPRIGHWLQEGKIRMLESSDARLNFVADIPDIVMAWLLGGARAGFRPVVLAQALGGIMAVGATIGLARQSGLGRQAALLAGGLFLGLANVAAQFTAAQTDLFTTGVFAVSFFLWLAALRRGECSVLGALGAGLALGAKGTLFYMAPGAALWVVWLAWKYPRPWRQWRRTIAAGLIGILLFAGPSFFRNWQAYGSALGPSEWVKKHHQGFDSIAGQLHKLHWNVTASLVQNFAPLSQPLGLRTTSAAIADTLMQQLPPVDAYTLPGLNRKEMLERILRLPAPDADVGAFGLIPFFLFVTGSVLAVTRGKKGNGSLIAIWSAGVVLFLVFFHAMQQWHPYAFRYFVLVAPWVAIVAAWGIEQVGRAWSRVAWALVTLAAMDVCWTVTMHQHQGGWKSATHPTRSLGSFVTRGWSEWSRGLGRPDEPLLLALPEERPISAFYRQWPPRTVEFLSARQQNAATAEEMVRGKTGWIIVPVTRFMGREGRVAGRAWLFSDDENSQFSVAAYRALDAGEKPEPIVYRQKLVSTVNSLRHEFLVKAVEGGTIRLLVTNPADIPIAFTWSTPLSQQEETLPARGKTILELPMPPDAVGEMWVAFEGITGREPASEAPILEIQH